MKMIWHTLWQWWRESRVSDAWLQDNRRRACRHGVEQSVSTWPWQDAWKEK